MHYISYVSIHVHGKCVFFLDLLVFVIFNFCNLYFCIFLSLCEMKMGKSLQSMAVFSLPLGTALSSEGHFSCQRESGWDYLYPKYHPTVIGKLVTIFALFFAIWFKLCWCKFYVFVCCLNPAVFAEIHVQVCCLFYICMSLVLFVVWLQPCSLLIWNLWSNPWRGRGKQLEASPAAKWSFIAL